MFTALKEIIVRKIKNQGPISFYEFMETALYYPGLGYYTSAGNKIGATGDFYTSAYLTPAFGAMIGRQLEEMWRLLGEKEFTVVEFGAGAGVLCGDILAYAATNQRFYEQLNYCIIEKSAVMREREKKYLAGKVSWFSSLEEMGPFDGCVLSNELIDNLSVHQVVMGEKLMEVFVDYEDDFTELLRPAGAELNTYFEELNIGLEKGFRTEVNLEATAWIKEVATWLRKGYVLTIDYGYASPQLYRDSHREGTLVCYNDHNVQGSPYQEVGNQDITAHVNFSALMHWGGKCGLATCGFTNQANFLLGLGFTDYLNLLADPRENRLLQIKKEAMIRRRLLVDMGTRFKVLIQCKNTPDQPLRGLRLAEPEMIAEPPVPDGYY